jgi:hypothetical protein
MTMTFGADNLMNEDPRLSAALDQILAPAALPAGMNERIVARTGGLLEVAPLGVLARIDRLYRWPRAVAALVVGAVTLGIIISAARIVSGAHNLAVVHDGLASMPAYEPPNDATPIDISSASESVDAKMHNVTADLDAAEATLNQGLTTLEQQDDEDSSGTF